MNFGYKLPELKEFCKERGLKISGTKIKLIDDLIKTDESSMIAKVKHLNPLICSKAGLELAQDYVNSRKLESKKAEDAILNALLEKNISLASRILINYEANQVFSRGFGVDWKNTKEEEFTPVLSLIFSDTPAILRDVHEETFDVIRVAAGFNYL